MAKAQHTPDARILVGIDISKNRHEVLMFVPGRMRRRRITVLNTADKYQRLIAVLRGFELPAHARGTAQQLGQERSEGCAGHPAHVADRRGPGLPRSSGGTTSSTARGKSCPSECANGHMGCYERTHHARVDAPCCESIAPVAEQREVSSSAMRWWPMAAVHHLSRRRSCIARRCPVARRRRP